jgi:peroxiredoxin
MMRSLFTVAWFSMVFMIVGCAESTPPTKIEEEPLPTPQAMLEPGAEMPKLVARAWHNGEPKAYDAPGVKLTVVDVAAIWCPFCSKTAPDLVASHKEFAPQGVQFVTITSDYELAMKAYVEKHNIPWPVGFECKNKMYADLGAFELRPVMPSAHGIPVVYLVNRDGRVLWNDNRSRFRHRPGQDLISGLEKEIKKHLKP